MIEQRLSTGPCAPPKKDCPICKDPKLTINDFGICRSRADGRNLYCKSCVRKKVAAQRASLKEYRALRRAVQMQLRPEGWLPPESRVVPLSKLAPNERVLDAIKGGCKTQKEIAQETRLGNDEIGDAIANLLLWTREIKTELVNNTRVYSLRADQPGMFQPAEPAAVSRKRDVPSGFASLAGLMPGKQRKVG